ncbi:acyltransferase family protein [Robertkochia sediminum]|uniref:acyltransferase family protein n=1 Tax=Robertkochia sediminum TaxID=2785326 RepID=UPI001933360E|nr:acyltransferase family protein [Robertkochia sediminum]MBL7472023.1 acyltransferase family protein [Robertkochia sediminum]
MKTNRRYDIDWLRVIAIGLLLLYHIAIVFQPWATFIGFIRSDELLEGLWKPMTMLNVWRIPFLFYVSGMGVFFAIRKRNWKQLLSERARRILLPFVFGFAAITPLHILLFQKYYHMPLSYYPHAGHLWFLGNIFAYVVVLSPLFFRMKKSADSKWVKGLARIMRNPLGPLSVTVFFIAEIMLVKPQLFAMYAETWHGFFLGLLAFFFGFVFMLSGNTFWETVRKWRWGYFALAAVLFGVRYALYATEAPGYLMAVESNSWIFWVFGTGYTYLNRPGAVLSYLSEAAYPVYILHMFVLYAGTMLILPTEIPAILQFVAISAFTFAGCFLIYELVVKRVSFLRPLFGLKPRLKKEVKLISTIAEV